VAVTFIVAELPSQAVTLTGWTVITGLEFTVTVTGVEVTVLVVTHDELEIILTDTC